MDDADEPGEPDEPGERDGQSDQSDQSDQGAHDEARPPERTANGTASPLVGDTTRPQEPAPLPPLVADRPPRRRDQPGRRRRSRLRRVLVGLLALGILAAAGAGGYILAESGALSDLTGTGTGDTEAGAPADDTEDLADTEAPAGGSGETDRSGTEAADGSSDTAADAAGPDSAANGAASGTTDETADEAADSTGTDGDGATAGATEPEMDPLRVTVEVDDDGGQTPGGADRATGQEGEALNDGNRQALFRDGKVYLTGAVPSQEVAELIVAKAAAVVGPENVVNEYEIDPSVVIRPGDSAPLYVEDVILFDFNSVEIAQPFLPILDLGVLLLRQNPQATVTVVTRTDAVGSEQVNLDVATKRAQAVINYWISNGVDPDQIEADPRGEEGASEEDDRETAAAQRRAEFIITGLLD